LFEECDSTAEPTYLGCADGAVNVTNLSHPSPSQGCEAANWAADFYSSGEFPEEGSEPYAICVDGKKTGEHETVEEHHGRDLLLWSGAGCADDDCAKGHDCSLIDTETFWVYHSIRTTDNPLKFKHHYHKQGSVSWYEDSAFTGTVYNCNNNFNIGSKWSRPFLDGPGNGLEQTISGWTRANVGTCSVDPVSCAPELSNWNYPANHLNVQMEGLLGCYKGIEIATAANNVCSPTYLSGDNRIIKSLVKFHRCRFYIGSNIWNQGVSPVERNACPCSY
jgi:hypothetical protein